MNNSKTLIPAPQSNGFTAGAGSPQQSAMAAGIEKSNLLNKLNQVGKGKKKMRYRGGATDIMQANRIPIAVPTTMYANANGGQGVTNQTIQNAQNAGQLSTNNKFYSNVTLAKQTGGCGCDWKGGKRSGYKREKKAGTHIMGPNTTWGCYSGGKRRKTKRRQTKRRNIKRRTTKRRKYG
uniref:Uncharacterized protein n=1 Tax=viral metagenome TaxID=1070528 RepID=A0A6C0BAU0_9ZZZZ